MPRREDQIDLDEIEVPFDDDTLVADSDDPGAPDSDVPDTDLDGANDPINVGRVLDEFEDAIEAAQVDVAERLLARLEPHADELDDAFGVQVGDLYEMIAFAVLERDHDHGRAMRLQERAVQLGCEDQVGATVSLAWWLLDAGDRERGEALFAGLLDDDPDSVLLRVDLGLARHDTDPDGALLAFDQAIILARRSADAEGLATAQIEREGLRFVRGLPADADDRAALASQRERRNEHASGPGRGATARWDDDPVGGLVRRAVGWFPDEQLSLARERWPRLSAATHDSPEAHRRNVERGLRQLATLISAPLAVVGLTVAEVVAADVDPTWPRGLDDLAESRHAEGRSTPWPPGRNDPCWCGSGRKYKRCCGGY